MGRDARYIRSGKGCFVFWGVEENLSWSGRGRWQWHSKVFVGSESIWQWVMFGKSKAVCVWWSGEDGPHMFVRYDGS